MELLANRTFGEVLNPSQYPGQAVDIGTMAYTCIYKYIQRQWVDIGTTGCGHPDQNLGLYIMEPYPFGTTYTVHMYVHVCLYIVKVTVCCHG